MSFTRRCRSSLYLQITCWWLLIVARAGAQIDFGAGSVIDSGIPLTAAPAASPAATFATQFPENIPAPPPTLGSGSTGYLTMPASDPAAIAYHVGGQARGYYINDQRIEFTGLEATFAVEGVINGGVTQRSGDWDLSLETQIFLNEPFDKNVFVDSQQRRSFAPNFDIDPLQISQLYLGARNGDFYTAIGRFVTPFGRFYFPNFRNNFDDSPFIRSEAIQFRETGMMVQWDPDPFVFTAALTNGNFLQDTNSSKALVARVGVEQPWYAFGSSVKWQDGNGSETQKVFNNHVGVDGMLRFGNWTLSAEAIYDQYGLRKPGLLPYEITWGRSLYFRDLNNGFDIPITGWGYYINLGYEGPNWTLMLNYGDFFPGRVGDPRQDTPTHRGLIKASRHWTRNFETYAVVLLENTLDRAFDRLPRVGQYVIGGAQFTW
ncbi:MAG TPA: hypothetical protein VGI40_15365 [Pirellulaceae bacterium]|jgi:hypothetical protein